ncbi:MAG: NAD(P)-binding protein, partial [Salinarimonas sp.]|nr:NAD(P)-binding protein [Salinarimonas sp.]
MAELETDYLVIGAGASGMAFVDTLLAHSGHDMILLDRRHAPGGHWLDAYPFVRLHQPSAIYGVESLPLGAERIDTSGPNAGYYERAGAAEICAYYERVLHERMLPTGRLHFLPLHDYQGQDEDAHQSVSCLTGKPCRIHVRRALVDARYLEAVIPAHRPPPFAVDPEMRVIPPNTLPAVTAAPSGFTVIGAGKTAMDTVVWLLEHGVAPEGIRWIRPRDAWLSDRGCLQALDLAVPTIACVARTTEAMAQAQDIADLFRRLQAAGLFDALDP